MEPFDEQKQRQLAKDDLSKKGAIDEGIRPLVELINSLKNYYTTSSCAGRTVLLVKKSEKKFDTSWLYIDHQGADAEKIKDLLSQPPKHPVWLKQESAIVHLCCRNLKAAEKILIICKESGFKHSGILSLGKRIIVQVLSSENIETIVAAQGKLLVSEEYLQVLVDECNKKMERNRQRLQRLYCSLQKAIAIA